MTQEPEPTYEELKRRLAYAEAALQAIREDQCDAMTGDRAHW
jgi:hypothetical protein